MTAEKSRGLTKSNAHASSREVDAYIEEAPEAVRVRLRKVRKTIRAAVPDSIEVISYRMPAYSYPGYERRGIVVWFALQGSYIGLYLRPPTIANHRKELAGYTTTKSAVHLPHDEELPVRLIEKLVKASARLLKSRGRLTH